MIKHSLAKLEIILWWVILVNIDYTYLHLAYWLFFFTPSEIFSDTLKTLRTAVARQKKAVTKEKVGLRWVAKWLVDAEQIQGPKYYGQC